MKFLSSIIITIIVSISISVFPQEIKKEETGFTTWYEIYYEAEEYIKIGRWQDAIDNLHLVLVKQQKDRRNARTYGMNFIKEFTPNRNLGICYYHISDFEFARKYLEIHLRQFPTDSGKEYLEKVNIELEKEVKANEHFEKGISYFERKEYTQSIKEMEEVLKIRPDYNVAKRYIERATDIMNVKKKIKK